MEQRQYYEQCKQRNESESLAIKGLELQIAKVKQLIREKHQANQTSQKRIAQYKQMRREQDAELSKFKAMDKKPAQFTIPLPVIGKRDLTTLLSAPESICKKIEDLIQTHYLSDHPPTASDLAHIKQMITRLPAAQRIPQVNKLAQHLSQDATQVKTNSSKYNHQRHHDIDKAKEKEILSFYLQRDAKVEELTSRNDQLENECKEAEMDVAKRVQELYSDPDIQSALIKSIRVKALSNASQTVFNSMRNQIEDLNKQIQLIEGRSECDLEEELEARMKLVMNKQMDIKALLNANAQHHAITVEERNKEKEDVKKRTKLLLQRIITAKQKIEKREHGQSTVATETDDSSPNPIEEAKSVISPHSAISTARLFEEITNTMFFIDTMEKDSVLETCHDIRVKLEKLVDKRRSSLNLEEIPTLKDIPKYHDGIDTVIQSIDVIMVYLQDKEKAFVEAQQEKLSDKMDVTNKIEVEISKAWQTLDERKLLQEVGHDFAVDDKNFKEWLREL